MRKLRPDSNQSKLSPGDTERLMEACRSMGYADAVAWAKLNLKIDTTTASLCRWYRKQSEELTSGQLKAAIKASENFDAELDSRNLDARAANALRTLFWEAVQSRDVDSIERLGKMVFEHNKVEGKATELELKQQRIAQQEDALKLSREKFEAQERRLAAAQEVVADETMTPEQRIQKTKEIFGLK